MKNKVEHFTMLNTRCHAGIELLSAHRTSLTLKWPTGEMEEKKACLLLAIGGHSPCRQKLHCTLWCVILFLLLYDPCSLYDLAAGHFLPIQKQGFLHQLLDVSPTSCRVPTKRGGGGGAPSLFKQSSSLVLGSCSVIEKLSSASGPERTEDLCPLWCLGAEVVLEKSIFHHSQGL